jgi:hypothetical protein
MFRPARFHPLPTLQTLPNGRVIRPAFEVL